MVERLGDLFCERGIPAYIRLNNRPEFTVKTVQSMPGVLVYGRVRSVIPNCSNYLPTT